MAKTARPSLSVPVPRRHEIDELAAATSKNVKRLRHEREEFRALVISAGAAAPPSPE